MTDTSGDGGFEKRLSKLRHDMRTPVGHMIGYAEMLEEDLDEESAKMHSGDLQAIQNAGQRLLALIDDHLNAARESGPGFSRLTALPGRQAQMIHQPPRQPPRPRRKTPATVSAH